MLSGRCMFYNKIWLQWLECSVEGMMQVHRVHWPRLFVVTGVKRVIIAVRTRSLSPSELKWNANRFQCGTGRCLK